MKVDKVVKKLERADIEIWGATLLSADEEETLLAANEKTYMRRWWLRSPGGNQNRAATVDLDGSVYFYGDSVHIDAACARPALKISFDYDEFSIGDTFIFGGIRFKIISEHLAWMYKNDIGYCIFRENREVDDTNNYEDSDIKKYVDNWFETVKEKEGEMI